MQQKTQILHDGKGNPSTNIWSRRKINKISSIFESLGEFNFEEFQIGREAVQNLRLNGEPQKYLLGALLQAIYYLE